MKALLLLLASLALSHAEPKPPIGVPADARHFNGRWYRVYIEDVKTWARAKERAALHGGQLACIPDAETHALIANIAQGRTLWLGGAKGADALWYWIDGSPLTFAAWGPNQPEAGKGENWLVVSGGKLHDHHGRGGVPIIGFICEWPASKRPQ